jgi:CRP/FNR family transcriptional regulator
MEQAVRTLAVRNRKLMQMLEAQSLHSVRARLAAYLLAVSQGQTEFSLMETNEAIAGHLGTVREVVSRTLRSFKDDGFLALRGRRVIVHDFALLQRVAASAAL